MAEKNGDDEHSNGGGTSNNDLEVLTGLPKGFWETLKYFGKGVVASPFYSFLVVLALLLLAAAAAAMNIGGQAYVVVLFGIFVIGLVIIALFGTRIQKTGLRKEVEAWTEKNQADAFVGKVIGDPSGVSRAVQNTIGKNLEAYRDFVATFLDVPKGSVRTNIFRPNGKGSLDIPSGLYFNMDDPNELTIELPPGEGATGSAFSLRKPIIATRETAEFPYGVPRPQRAKVSDRLQWILSLPILANGKVIGVLNADGVDVHKTKKQLRPIIPAVRPWADFIGNLLESQSNQ